MLHTDSISNHLNVRQYCYIVKHLFIKLNPFMNQFQKKTSFIFFIKLSSNNTKYFYFYSILYDNNIVNMYSNIATIKLVPFYYNYSVGFSYTYVCLYEN